MGGLEAPMNPCCYSVKNRTACSPIMTPLNSCMIIPLSVKCLSFSPFSAFLSASLLFIYFVLSALFFYCLHSNTSSSLLTGPDFITRRLYQLYLSVFTPSRCTQVPNKKKYSILCLFKCLIRAMFTCIVKRTSSSLECEL